GACGVPLSAPRRLKWRDPAADRLDHREEQIMIGIGAWKQRLPQPGEALPGRAQEMPLHHNRHHVLGAPLRDGFEGLARVQFGMGCFWGVERKFWTLPGVVTTAAGYAGGETPNPTYREVCSGQTGHAEVVLVVYEPATVAFETLLRTFWENHDPTQGMRQGNDVGTQYRSVLFCSTADQHALALASRDAYQPRLREAGHGVSTQGRSVLCCPTTEQHALARASRDADQARLREAGHGAITTEIRYPAPAFHYAEDEHQQYLSKNPAGYCGLGGTGVSCPVGIAT